MPKKSFGKLSGSFVEVSNSSESKVTVIAEGIETALSLSSAGIEGKILCSLGISNIKNYPAKIGEKIIIAADNDGNHHITTKTIEKAKELLISKGADLEIIKPEKLGDFNDLLKECGAEVVKDSFNNALKIKTEEKNKTIKEHLAKLYKIKQAAKTPEETLQAVYNEHKYLASLYKNSTFHLKYHSKELYNTIQKAHELYNSNEIDKLNKSVYYAYQEKVTSEEDLINKLKASHSLDKIRYNINMTCHKYYCKLLSSNCRKIDAGEVIIDKGRKFNNVVEYLEHYKQHVDHEMLPIRDMNKIISKELGQQQLHHLDFIK